MSESFSVEPYAVEFVDTDGDGYQETTVVDADGDAVLDTALDGYDDVAVFDNVPDGEFVADVVAVDVDGDGYADVVSDDTDLDGIFDTETHPAGVALADANPYGAELTGEPAVDSGSGSGSGEGSVITGEGGDAIFVDPDGSTSFSGSNTAGDTFSFES
jgi:hypothetical protein